jgi:hypothetical protein
VKSLTDFFWCSKLTTDETSGAEAELVWLFESIGKGREDLLAERLEGTRRGQQLVVMGRRGWGAFYGI